MNNESKKLKLVEQKSLRGMCWHATALCVALTNEHNIPWFYENYVNMNCMKYDDGNIDLEYCGNSVNIGKARDVLEENNFNLHNCRRIDNIIEFLKENIEKDIYVGIYLDQFYLSMTRRYKKEHKLHNSLIYGYDDHTETFNIFIQAFDRFESFIVSYAEIVESFQECLDADYRPSPNIITLYTIRPTHRPYPFNLIRFANELGNYISASVEPNHTFMLEHLGYIYKENLVYGIDIYDVLIERLSMKAENMLNYIRRRTNAFFEHKKMLLERFEYIIKEFKATSRFKNLINEFEELIEDYYVCLSLAIKFENNMKQDKNDNILNKLINRLKGLKQRELEILGKIYVELFAVEKCSHIKNAFAENLIESAEKTIGENSDYVMYSWSEKQDIRAMRIFDDTPMLNSDRRFIVEYSSGDKEYVSKTIDSSLIYESDKIRNDIDWVKITNMTNQSIDFDHFTIEILKPNCALFKRAFASSWDQEISKPEKAFIVDGIDYNSDKDFQNWHAIAGQGNGEYIGVDFEEEIEFNTIVMKQNKWLNSIYSFKIQVLDADDQWITVYHHIDKDIGNEPESFTFDAVKSRKMRIVFTDVRAASDGWIGLSLDYVEVYHCKKQY